MTSGGRELLKWVAVVFMTGDHVVKGFSLGHVPVVSELGRLAFPVFSLVMAYNLAQPGADIGKSVRRLLLWAAIAQPAHALVFGRWLPLNVLASFALAAAVVSAIRAGRWWAVAVLAGPLPLLVDYQWAGTALVVTSWLWFVRQRDLVDGGASINGLYFETLADWRDSPYLVALSMSLLCAYNGNGWALLATPLMLLGSLEIRVPRTRWAFYGYYAGHLAVLALVATFAGV